MSDGLGLRVQLGAANAMAAQACGVAPEAYLIGLLEDKTVDSNVKKRKIEKEVNMLELHADLFGYKIEVDSRVMARSTSFLLDRSKCSEHIEMHLVCPL